MQPFLRIWNRLTEPSVVIEQQQRRQARVLAVLLLVMVLVILLIELIIFISVGHDGGTSGIEITLPTIGLLGIAYFISRSRRYNLSVWFMLVVISAAIFISTIGFQDSPDLTSLYFLAIPLILSSVFISLSGSAVLTAVYVLAISGMTLLAPSITFAEVISGPLAFVVVFSMSLHVLIWYRVSLERDRNRIFLEQSERFRSLFERVPVGLYRTTPAGEFLEANMALTEIFGYPDKDSLLKANVLSVFEDPKQREGMLTKIEQDSCTYNVEMRLLKRDGSEIWVRDNGKIIYADNGQVKCYEGSLEDITERRLAEQALYRKTYQQERLIRTARDLTRNLDVKEVLERVAQGAREIIEAHGCAIYLLEEDGNILSPVVAIDPPYEEEILAAPLDVSTSHTGRSIIEKQGLIVNNPAEGDEGTQIPGTPVEEEERLVIVPLISDDEVIGAMTLNRMGVNFGEEDLALAETFSSYASTAIKNAHAHADLQCEVEERKRAEKALRDSESRYRTLFDSAGDAIFLHDFEGKILDVNQLACERLGYDREALIGMNMSDMYTPEFANITPGQGEILIDHGQHIFETTHITRDGTSIPIELNANTIEYAGGKAILSIARDITERKRRAREQEIILKLATALRSAETLKEMLPIITDYVLKMFHGAGAAFAMCSSMNGTVVFELAGGAWTELTGDRFPSDEGLCGRVIRTGKPYLNNDLRSDPLETLRHWSSNADPVAIPSVSGPGNTGNLLSRNPGTSAIAGVPLIAKDETIGVLWVGRSAPFSKEDVQLITAIGEMAAISIQRAMLFDETQQRLEDLSMLYNLSQKIADSPLELTEIALVIAKQFVEVMGLPECSLSLLNGQNGTLLTIVDYFVEDGGEHFDEDYMGKEIDLADYPATARVIETRQPLVVNSNDVEADPAELAYMRETEIATLAILPLSVKGKAIGILELEVWNGVHHFTPGELNLAMTLANQAALALEHVRLYDDERRRSQEMEAIASVSAALRVANNSAEIYSVVLDQLFEQLQAKGALIGILDLQEKHLVLELGRGIWSAATGEVVPVERTGLSLVLSENSTLSSSDGLENGMLSVPESISNTDAGVGIPLIAKDKSIGVLWVGRDLAFTGNDMHLLSAIGDMAANAIQRATLHEETRRRVERLNALHNIDRAITTSFDLEIILNVLLDNALSQLNVDAVDLLLYEDPTYTLIYAGGRGFKTDFILNTAVRVGKGFAGKVALERKVIHIPDLSKVNENQGATAMYTEEGFVTYFGVPLIAKGQVKGVLELYNREAMTPDQEWSNFLDSLARQAAIAIDNSSLFENFQRSNLELTLAYDTTLEGWARALELRDKETEGHSRRVTEMTLKLSREMGLGGEALIHIRRGALLHDIGKMGLPDSILQKPGALTEEDWETMRQHPIFSFELLSKIPYLSKAMDIPYNHHEKWDGTGYPRGMKGDEIPIAARIFAVIDVWDALLSDRPYRQAWEPEKVYAYLREQAGLHFDPMVVEVFMRLLSQEAID